jgi:Fic family protein
MVSARLEGLQQLLTTRTDASAVLVGAVAHAEIAVVEPFGVGDAVVARAVEHMVLIAAGVDPYGLISCEAGHLARRDAYRTALVGYRDGGAPGVRDWLRHCAAALADGAAAASRPR